MRRGPRWCQSGRGPGAHAAGASVVPKQSKPPRPCAGGLVVPKRERLQRSCGRVLDGPKAKEARAPMRWGPWWSQSK